MKTLQIIMIYTIFVGCSNEQKNIKEVRKITEISFAIELDSLNNRELDTISLTEKFYTDNNRIIKSIEETMFDKEIIETEYIYNSFDKIFKEIVKIPSDTMTVNYFYDDSLLIKTETKTFNSEFTFEQISKHIYNKKRKLKEVIISQISYDFELRDTAMNREITEKYNKAEELISNETKSLLEPEGDRKFVYVYRSGKMIKSKGYNHKGELISITKFKYLFDKHGNWIEKQSYEDEKLKYTIKRQFEYK